MIMQKLLQAIYSKKKKKNRDENSFAKDLQEIYYEQEEEE